MSLAKANGFHLAVDLYNNGDGVGYKVFSTTPTTSTLITSNVANGQAGVNLLTSAAVKNAYATHTIDVFNGLVNWSIGGTSVFTGLSAAAIPSNFFLLERLYLNVLEQPHATTPVLGTIFSAHMYTFA